MSEYTFKVVVEPNDPDMTRDEVQELLERACANFSQFDVDELDE